MSGQLNAVALAQLEAWEAVANKWILVPQVLITQMGHRLGPNIEQLHYTCGGYPHTDYGGASGCNGSIWMLHDGSNYINCTITDVLAATVAHIRNVHRGLEDRVYAKMGPLR